MKLIHDLTSVAREFQIDGTFLGAEPYGSGHINDSYCAVFDSHGAQFRALFQRINHHVFKKPVALMENIRRVTAHLAGKAASAGAGAQRLLTLIPARDGRVFFCDQDDNYWRAYVFIENARTYDAVENLRQAFEAAKAFGNFQRLLADLPAPRLHHTIPDFHNTARRFAALEQAVADDAANRAAHAKAEIAFARKHRSIVKTLSDADLPERVTHNDCKFNNVMLDDATGEGVCVIDLDTVMPGLVLYDFGDMVRTTTSPAKEDERDLAKVEMQFPMFEALARGYLETAGAFLTRTERDHLAVSGLLITFEVGIRFLSDYLSGDTYFKVVHPDHNLERCRTQFKLMESIERQQERMTRCVEGAAV